MNGPEIALSGSSPYDSDILKHQLENLDMDHNIDLSPYKYIFDDPNQINKQTDAKYEIFISLTANVLENIEGVSFPESKHIASNNYYIPVPSGHNPDEYMSAFFEYMENCMNSAASQTSSTNEDK